ncbi:SGNH/GDSL hydrolase family protein [Salirhabdus sp. Marseille-P4669]|uniref:SGNH/GDSL hydrolase family protein n=1 Tax=Salirhabdus sp. Marseille-P4669 TaxID=2042310 RepID=UPI000C7A5CFC|nr:SGNH/GDSL hydrolase family protein [Salirhabdus sp. Marseille-P4669]
MSRMPLLYVALGDSLTVGTGSLFAPGFVEIYKNRMEQVFNYPIQLEKFAENGLRIPELKSMVESPMVLDAITQADIITITIGGNDLRTVWKNFERNPSPHVLGDSLEGILQDIWEIVDRVDQRKVDSHKPYAIRLMTLYNPYPNPIAARALEYFNHQLLSFTSSTIKVADVYTLFLGREQDLLFLDGFHPNKHGYRIIAEAFHNTGYDEFEPLVKSHI